jgi:serine/threonine protein kinase/tetratricopeptide (TPR) repeat protein
MIGQTVSHYKIIEKLGGGGMGVVYKAEDTRLKRTVALKFLPPDLTRDDEAKTRFVHEAQAASSLDHNNICTIYEISEIDDGQLFIAMAYYEGETLREKIDRAPLKLEESIDTALQIAGGLAEAHQRGLVHRDIKPANILITKNGTAKIVDFGLAKLSGQTRLTKAGSTVGTVAYMSPEQARGEDVDHRSDIWSLGVILYEMVTGQQAFKGEYDNAVMFSIVSVEPEPLTGLRSGVPMELERIVKKAMEKSPDERYQHMDEMLVDLKHLQKDSGSSRSAMHAPAMKSPVKSWAKRVLIPAALLVALLVIFFLMKPFLFEDVLVSEPKPIAVIAFVNQTGDPSYDYLREAIPNLLITSLEQSRYLRVMTWERMNDVVKQMGKANMATIDKELGFELCRREGVNAIVIGSFIKAGEVFATDVKVLDVETKELLKSVSVRGEGVQSIINSQVDELSKAIARGVGLSERRVAASTTQIASVTTSSMEAYNAFLRGREQYEKGYWLEALPSLQQAVRLDTTFAMAYLYLGRAFAIRANTRAAHENYRKAKAFAANASEKERLYIDASYASAIDKNPGKRIEILKIMEQRYPKEKQVYADLGQYYAGQGMHKEAVDVYTKALVLDPQYGMVLNLMAYACADVGDYGMAIEYLGRYAAASPGEPDPLDSMGDMYFFLGDIEAATAKYKEALAIRPEFFSSYKIAYICALKEDYAAAVEWVDYFQKHSPPAISMGGARAWKSFYYWMMGQRRQSNLLRDEAQRLWGSMENRYFVALVDFLSSWLLLAQGELDSGLKRQERSAPVLVEVDPTQKAYYIAELELYRGLAALQKGKVELARRQVAPVEAQIPQVTPMFEKQVRYEYTLFCAAVLLAEGKADSAISVADRVIAPRPRNWSVEAMAVYSIISSYPLFRDVVARAYLRKGQVAEAIVEYERLTTFDFKKADRRIISPEYHYSLAKLYEQTGQKVKATEQYERLLRIWKNADSDLPELADARARLARLKQGKIH